MWGAGTAAIWNAVSGGGKRKKSGGGGSSGPSPEELMAMVDKGFKKGEEFTGFKAGDFGGANKALLQALQNRRTGQSAGANALARDQRDTNKQLKAQQMMQGGGANQMNLGQIMQQRRQQDAQKAQFLSNEERGAIADEANFIANITSDIAGFGGVYASALGASQRAPQTPINRGPLGSVFDFIGLS